MKGGAGGCGGGDEGGTVENGDTSEQVLRYDPSQEPIFPSELKVKTYCMVLLVFLLVLLSCDEIIQ